MYQVSRFCNEGFRYKGSTVKKLVLYFNTNPLYLQTNSSFMGLPEIEFITQEQYLEAERAALDKHEYYGGEIFAMNAVSLTHNIISSNTVGSLSSKLKGKSCSIFGSDLRIHIPNNSL